MIRLDPAWFVLFYLLFFLSVILLVWIAFEIQRRKFAVRKREGTSECRVCGMIFKHAPTCPRCGAATGKTHRPDHQQETEKDPAMIVE
jgi:uncharacterized paraquat-inducible protein A